jgi:pantothenate kinase-related protein Tda10
VKFPEYGDPLPAGLVSYRSRFGKLAGELDSDTVFYLVGYLALNIAKCAAESSNKSIVVSIAGAQGTGKSTMTRLLAYTLRDCFNTSTATLSLDDFYLPLEKRRQLAVDIHPLLRVRGVPGTHDLSLMETVLTDLRGDRLNCPFSTKERTTGVPGGKRLNLQRLSSVKAGAGALSLSRRIG